MSYQRTIEYKVIPKDAYRVIRYCAGCGKKTSYVSTGCFRVNANGKNIDVWLIYQCPHCKHTYNLTIYERKRITEMDPKLYVDFSNNDENLAAVYGVNKQVFDSNSAVIDMEAIEYDVNEVGTQSLFEGKTSANMLTVTAVELIIQNPSGLKLRTDKVLAKLLGLSRSKLKSYVKEEVVVYAGNHIGFSTKVLITDPMVFS